jgi:hypothetical protein
MFTSRGRGHCPINGHTWTNAGYRPPSFLRSMLGMGQSCDAVQTSTPSLHAIIYLSSGQKHPNASFLSTKLNWSPSRSSMLHAPPPQAHHIYGWHSRYPYALSQARITVTPPKRYRQTTVDFTDHHAFPTSHRPLWHCTHRCLKMQMARKGGLIHHAFPSSNRDSWRLYPQAVDKADCNTCTEGA